MPAYLLLPCLLLLLLHPQKGKEGVREQYETTEEFHEKWKMKARDMLAKSEWRRRKLTKRVSLLISHSSEKCII
jgi:hypothetical protein